MSKRIRIRRSHKDLDDLTGLEQETYIALKNLRAHMNNAYLAIPEGPGKDAYVEVYNRIVKTFPPPLLAGR